MERIQAKNNNSSSKEKSDQVKNICNKNDNSNLLYLENVLIKV
jgi:hypothetical protein